MPRYPFVVRCLLLLVLLHVPTCRSQTIEALGALVKQGKDMEANDMARQMIHADSPAALPYLVLGAYYNSAGRYDSAIHLLQQAVRLDRERSWISGWAYIRMGEAFIWSGHQESGIPALEKAISLYKTLNSVRYARHVLDSIGAQQPPSDLSFPKWTTMEGRHLVFHFEDTAGWGGQVSQYMEEHEQAYDTINRTFQAVLPQKLALYVWTNKVRAEQLLHQQLGFSDPEHYSCQIHRYQSRGHEITHVLSYWAWGIRADSFTRLINEGVAVAFNQNRDDKYEQARKSIAGKDFHSILEIWHNDRSLGEEVVYPVGGAFLTFLLEKNTPEEFRKLIKHQTIEQARRNYGELRFADLVKTFDTLMGMRYY